MSSAVKTAELYWIIQYKNLEFINGGRTKMKRVFVYILLGPVLFSSCILLLNKVQASEKSVISFLSNEEEDFPIFIIDTDGKVCERLATNAMRKSSLTCSPIGYLFAFQSNEGGNPDIYKMDIRHKEVIQLTERAGRNLWPAWSPNGKWIAFVSDRKGTQDIYRMDVDGSNLIRLTDKGKNGRPAWSPDSQLIAFTSERNDGNSIYVMDAKGGQLKQLTEDLLLGASCTWSPDGKQIAYAAGNFAKEGMDIHTIDIDVKKIKKLTNMGQGIRSGNPAWSPDGKWIVYSVVVVVEWPNPANGFKFAFSDSIIYIVDNEGNDNGKPLEKTAGLSSDHVPVWTPLNFFSVSYMKVNK